DDRYRTVDDRYRTVDHRYRTVDDRYRTVDDRHRPLDRRLARNRLLVDVLATAGPYGVSLADISTAAAVQTEMTWPRSSTHGRPPAAALPRYGCSKRRRRTSAMPR